MSPCEQSWASSQRPSSVQRKVDRSTWAKFSGVSSCRTVTETWPAPAGGTPLSPPLPKGKNTRDNDRKITNKEERLTTLQYSNNITNWLPVHLNTICSPLSNGNDQIMVETYAVATNLPGKKSQDVSIILRLMDLQHRLHCGLHIVWDRTEEEQTIQSKAARIT